jgi:hypothetical protein
MANVYTTLSNAVWYTDKCEISTGNSLVTYQVYATALGSAPAAGNIYSGPPEVGAYETKQIYVGVGNYITITGTGYTAQELGGQTSAQAGTGNFVENLTPPIPVPTYTIENQPTSINSGSSGTFDITTTDITDGTTLYWTINNVTSTNADFTAVSGSFVIASNSGTFDVTTVSGIESDVTFTVSIRTVSIAGTIVDTSDSVTINLDPTTLSGSILIPNTSSRVTLTPGIPVGGAIEVTAVSQNVAGSDGPEAFFFRPNDPAYADIAPGWTVVGQPTWVVTSATSDPGDQYSTTVTITGGTFVSGQSYAFTGVAGSSTTPFTVEGWFYSTVTPGTDSGPVLLSTDTSSGTPAYAKALTVNISSATQIVVDSNGAAQQAFNFAETMLVNTWYYVAVTRDSSGFIQVWMGKDGDATATASTTGRVPVNGNVAWNLLGLSNCVGAFVPAGRYTTGYISNLRVDSTGLYATTAATIPVPTEPFEEIAGTVFLQNDNTLTDQTGNQTLTAVGSAVGNPANPFDGTPITQELVSFTSAGSTSWTAPARTTSVTYLVVGGGGGAGNGYDNAGGGGGGAGMVLTDTMSVTPGQSYTVTVGSGGNGGADARTNNAGTAGTDSIFGSVTALGGGQGLGSRTGGAVGAAQVGSSTAPTGGSGSGGGFGGKGGGGSSAGSANSGATGGAGGTGTASSITGSSVTYGVGGAGGGAGAPTTDGANGTTNRGNGGQGGKSTSADSAKGGDGGSGIVILSFNQ